MLVSYKAIGRNIRSARAEAGLTQEQAAEKLKMSQLHFGRLERGERPVSLELLAQIAEVLDVAFYTLLNGCVLEESLHGAQGSTHSVGRAVEQMTVGCSEQAKQLMLALCREVACSDKGINQQNV